MRFNYYNLTIGIVILLCCFFTPTQAQDCVTFTGLESGTYSVTGGFPQGTPFHTESGLPVSLAAYHFPNGDVKNNVYALAGEFFWSGLFIAANTTYLKLLKAGLLFDFTQPQPNKIAGSVTFDFLDWSGYVNLTINDNPVNVETTYSLMPTAIAPGITMAVTDQNVGSGGKMGSVTLTGDIYSIVIGAENFGVDNICFTLKDAPLPPCAYSGLSVSAPSCNSTGQFSVDLDFEHENDSGSFTVSGNGNVYGTYNTTDLPITLDALAGDNVTNYEFTITDSEDENCTISQTLGTVFCELPCAFTNLNVSPSACSNDATFSVTVDFDHANSSGSFIISGNGAVYGTYNTSQLPLTFGTFAGDGTTNYEFVITDSEDPNCVISQSIGTIFCQLPCSISNLGAVPGACNPNGQFMVELNFDHANTSGTFTVTGNGSNHGTFNTTDLPITIGPLAGDGTTNYEFVVTDVEFPNCIADTEIGSIFCPLPCSFGELSVTNMECDDNGMFEVQLDFSHANTSGSFTVNGNGVNYGTFSTANLPITLGPLNGDGTTNYEFVVTDSNSLTCTTSGTLGTVNCELPCLIINTVVTTTDCDNGEFFATINFDHEHTSGQYNISGNGNDYGVYNAGDLPVTLGPLAGDGTTHYEFIIEDIQSPDCADFAELGTIFCEIPVVCAISDLNISNMVCTSASTFQAMIDFNFEDVGTAGFRLTYQGSQVGIYDYTDLPLNLNNLNVGNNEVESITVCDTNNPNCCQTIEFEMMDCSGSGCLISDLDLFQHSCTDGQFMIDIDFEAQAGGLLGFQILGNGTNYGTFSYSEMPISLGPFEGDGITGYEFVVADMLDPNCSNFGEIEPYNCIEECIFTDMNVNVGSCDGNGQTYVLIDFAADNASSSYTVSANGVDFGTHQYASGSIAVGPIDGDGTTIYQFTITDSESGDCTDNFEVGPIECETTSTDDLSQNDIKIYTNQATDLLHIELKEAAQQGKVAIYNTIGQVQYFDQLQSGQNEIQYDLSALQTGIYICQVEVDGQFKSWKFSRF